MAIKSALLAVATTVALILALGNEWMAERAFDGGFAEQTRVNISSQLRFAFWEDGFADDRLALVIHLVALIVLAGVLGGIVGRARPAAAFVGGWGAFLAASVVSMGLYELARDEQFRQPGDDLVDRFTASAGFGTSLGMWLGWLVGLAVMLGSFGSVPRRTDTARPAPTPAPGAWPPPQPPPPPGPFGGPEQSGGYHPAPGDDPAAPPHPGATPPPPAPGPPVIGPPPDPDRTQVFGEPPARDR